MDLSAETTARLRMLEELVRRWSPRIQLVAPGDLADLWGRHISDSLQLIPLLPPAADRAIDLGSGAGFPGLVIAIAAGLHVDLVESDQRKAAFLREAARETQAPVTVHAARAETLRIAAAPLVTARALAPLSRLLALAAPFCAPDGVCLFPKGRSADTEIAEAARSWRFRVDQIPSHTHPEGRILRITELAHV